MCGRFSLIQRLDVLERIFKAKARARIDSRARYNIAPTQPVLAICQDEPDVIQELQWGITMYPDGKPPRTLVNARAETLRQRPAYAQAFASRRCVIPADGFFEWESRAGRRYPHYYRLKDHAPFAFAGVYDQQGGDRQCVIVTTDANASVARVHNRMPVILEDARAWLEEEDPEKLEALLRPLPEDALESSLVSPIVNGPQIDSPECIAPHEPPEISLFEARVQKK